MKYKTYGKKYVRNKQTNELEEKEVTIHGKLTEGSEISLDHGDETIIEVAPGVFIRAYTSEWGGISLTEKPDDWDSSIADRIKPLGEELPETPPENHMCRTRDLNDDFKPEEA